jgi:endonuclease YncB( thermonuclease family)
VRGVSRRDRIALTTLFLAISLCGCAIGLSGCAGQGESAAPAPSCRVVAVFDGDTIDVMWDRQTTRIRLHGVDSPELGQAFCQRAKEFTSDLAFAEDVSIEIRDYDQYGRTVAEVFLPDGRSLNLALLEAGLAWHYKRYSQDPEFAAAEEAARAAGRGLWIDANPTPPWDWRRQEEPRERPRRSKKRNTRNPLTETTPGLWGSNPVPSEPFLHVLHKKFV